MPVAVLLLPSSALLGLAVMEMIKVPPERMLSPVLAPETVAPLALRELILSG